jgi:ABC-type glutathione transport system ATPase component
MAMVNQSCGRVLLLEKGRLVEDGPAAMVVPKYLRAVSSGPAADDTP